MENSKDKRKKRKWLNYVLNGLFLIIILILIIPSWRQSFQTWFTELTLSDAAFSKTEKVTMPLEQRDWELISPDGTLYNFAEFEGKPIVLNFWGTWCPACNAEFPSLGRLRENFDNEVVFIAVTTESLGVLENSGYPEKYDFLYCTQHFPAFFEVNSFPTLCILDKEMNLVYKKIGAAVLDTQENITFLRGLL
ncbi:MAG: TlpA family protein disulfide reductase [Crocinitomicaceae bacterium]|nr:TlpA family protein disulfide reductase [Crocinitomicaceae bacterium]